MLFPTDDDDAPQATTCPTCGEELLPSDDFCFECGHAVTYRGEVDDDAHPELDRNAGDICPRCGATHMVIQAQGYPQCESCGYTERH